MVIVFLMNEFDIDISACLRMTSCLLDFLCGKSSVCKLKVMNHLKFMDPILKKKIH